MLLFHAKLFDDVICKRGIVMQICEPVLPTNDEYSASHYKLADCTVAFRITVLYNLLPHSEMASQRAFSLISDRVAAVAWSPSIKCRRHLLSSR